MEHPDKFTYLKSANVDYIDELFTLFSRDPASVDASWRYFFEGMELGSEAGEPALRERSRRAKRTHPRSEPEAKVAELIMAYRELGRMLAEHQPARPAPRRRIRCSSSRAST